MIVTIDGPAGAGKSTAAHGLAARLGFDTLDTGAMYRAVAVALRSRGVDLADHDAVGAAVDALRITMSPGHVAVDGVDLTPLIRSPEASQGASQVAVIPAVRRFLVGEQRRAAAGRKIVCEGRDQGTFVFPDAACKFFLTADPRKRAERRWAELKAKGSDLSLDAVLAAQAERDARDAGRDLAPLAPAPDAVVVDTTELTHAAVLARLEGVVRGCLART